VRYQPWSSNYSRVELQWKHRVQGLRKLGGTVISRFRRRRLCWASTGALECICSLCWSPEPVSNLTLPTTTPSLDVRNYIPVAALSSAFTRLYIFWMSSSVYLSADGSVCPGYANSARSWSVECR